MAKNITKRAVDELMGLVGAREKYHTRKMKAYILLNTKLGKEPEVIKAMEGVKEIKAVHSLFGVYDIIIKVEMMDKVKGGRLQPDKAP